MRYNDEGLTVPLTVGFRTKFANWLLRNRLLKRHEK